MGRWPLIGIVGSELAFSVVVQIDILFHTLIGALDGGQEDLLASAAPSTRRPMAPDLKIATLLAIRSQSSAESGVSRLRLLGLDVSSTWSIRRGRAIKGAIFSGCAASPPSPQPDTRCTCCRIVRRRHSHITATYRGGRRIARRQPGGTGDISRLHTSNRTDAHGERPDRSGVRPPLKEVRHLTREHGAQAPRRRWPPVVPG